jgi:pimeloyl-ACP methyl ester carboxylesterase
MFVWRTGCSILCYRYPTKVRKLILESTTAKAEINIILDAFERLGGMEARRIAEARWLYPSKETRARYLEVCLPLYRSRTHIDPDAMSRMIRNDELALHFSGSDGEFLRVDYRKDLRRILCPTLVLAGDRDPMTPMPFSETIVANLPEHLVRFERFAGCGHGVTDDDPVRAFGVIRDFLQS